MKKKLLLVLTVLFSILVNAQVETSDNLESISKAACECIYEIDLNESKEIKSEKISDCIKAAISADQLQSKLTELFNKTKDTLDKIEDITKVDTLTLDGDVNIVINDKENYDEVEEYLYENCPVMKTIYFTDNKRHKNSFSDRKKAMKFYEEGQTAFANEEYAKAITLFNKAVKIDKNFAFAWDNLGYSYRRLGNYKQAIDCYKKSLALDPKGKMPLMNIAVAYQLDNDLKSSKKAYQHFGELYPDDPEAFYGLGRIYMFEDDYEPALDNMIKAYMLYVEMESPYNIDAQKHIVMIYNSMEENGTIEKFYEIAKKHNLTINE